MNKVEIFKHDENTHIYVNGEKVYGVLDYQIRTNSKDSHAELVLVLDVVSLKTDIRN